MKKISVVSPCYNEEGNVEELYLETRAVFESLPEYDYEHIFVDNDSTDQTVKVLKNIALKEPRLF